MKTLIMSVVVIACLLCPLSFADGNAKQEVLRPVLEPIHGIQLTKTNIAFTVSSTGCTAKKDFILVLIDDSLALIRIRPDYCEARQHTVKISFGFSEVIGLKSPTFKTKNKFAPVPK